MRLENLYFNFGESSAEKQQEYVAVYRVKRAEDMAKPPNWPKQKKKGKGKAAIQLTKEELLLQSLLKLTKKEVIAMRKI